MVEHLWVRVSRSVTSGFSLTLGQRVLLTRCTKHDDTLLEHFANGLAVFDSVGSEDASD